MTLDQAIFGVSSIVAIFGIIMMLAQRNPVASVLYLILSLVSQAVLYIQLSAIFLAGVLIIVYAGAIMILFLFVIMLLNLRGTEDLGPGSKPVGNITKYAVSALLLAELVFMIRTSFFSNPGGTGVGSLQPDGFGSVKQVASLFFTKYLYPFELVSILLLAAIVGAVVMAKKELEGEPEHHELPQPSDTTEKKEVANI